MTTVVVYKTDTKEVLAAIPMDYCRHCSRICITDSRNFCKYQQQSGFVGGTGLYG